MFFEKLTDGLASEMIDVNYDPDKFDSERKALLNGTKGHYTHEFTKKIPGLGEAMGNIEQIPQVKAPLFLLETINVKNEKEAKDKGYVYIKDDDIKDMYRKQYPSDTKTVDVNKMRKILNKEFSRHRLYFDGDFAVVKQLVEKERQKEKALEKGSKEDYIRLIGEQKQIQKDRQENVKNILLNIYIPKPDDFKKSRDNVGLSEAMDEMQKNNSYKGFQIEEFQNPVIPKKGNDNPKELNDILNNLRNRLGN